MKSKHVGVVLLGGPHLAGVAGLREGLETAGLQEGTSFMIDARDAKRDLQAVEAAAAELERQGAAVIVAFSTSATLATQRTTINVPVVFAAGSDPVAFGFVASIPRPGGRFTGVHTVIADSTAKRFELLRGMVPTVRRVLTFYNPASPSPSTAAKEARRTATSFGIELVERHVRSTEELREGLQRLQPVTLMLCFSSTTPWS